VWTRDALATEVLGLPARYSQLSLHFELLLLTGDETFGVKIFSDILS
jgi:hypothetical protein